MINMHTLPENNKSFWLQEGLAERKKFGDSRNGARENDVIMTLVLPGSSQMFRATPENGDIGEVEGKDHPRDGVHFLARCINAGETVLWKADAERKERKAPASTKIKNMQWRISSVQGGKDIEEEKGIENIPYGAGLFRTVGGEVEFLILYEENTEEFPKFRFIFGRKHKVSIMKTCHMENALQNFSSTLEQSRFP